MDTMNALVWKGDGALSLERRPIPALQGPRDAIVRVTRSTICTSDLHIRSGAVPRARPGVVLGLGPVGLCAAECAALLGAAHVIGVEPDPWRRRMALEQGLVALALNPVDPELESAVAAATEGRGADAVIECVGRRDTFQAAWRLARPNGTVALVAMYEENQTLPLPAMYGKNLVFKTGGVDASRGPELVSLLAQGKLRTDFLITHRGPLSEILEGYRVFESHEGHCLKWVVTPG